MTTRNVSLSDALNGFVEQQVASGVYPDANEVVHAGLRLLKSRADRDALGRFLSASGNLHCARSR